VLDVAIIEMLRAGEPTERELAILELAGERELREASSG
jgi:hypothetical protein